jgi:hypothetical protein
MFSSQDTDQEKPMLDPDIVIKEFEKRYGGRLRCTACAWTHANRITSRLYSLTPYPEDEGSRPLPVIGIICEHCGRLMLFVPKEEIPLH